MKKTLLKVSCYNWISTGAQMRLGIHTDTQIILAAQRQVLGWDLPHLSFRIVQSIPK